MRFLTEMYQTGRTPLREALNRLTADGLVECRERGQESPGKPIGNDSGERR